MVKDEGIACIIANSGNLGLPGLRLASTIEVDDGLLDVIVVNRSDLTAVISLISSMMGQDVVEKMEDRNDEAEHRLVRHWQARKIRIHTEPSDVVQCDGELIGTTPKEIGVLPAALQVVVQGIVTNGTVLAPVSSAT
jgi:diacylglycerol kinase (ATP)